MLLRLSCCHSPQALVQGAPLDTSPKTMPVRLWQNKVPKAARIPSLKTHIKDLIRRTTYTTTWKELDVTPLCRELERLIEEQNPNESEERISAMCHKRMRKFGTAFRCGWELELLGDVQEEVNFTAVLFRLETLGKAKQENYGRIKKVDRIGAKTFLQPDQEGADEATIQPDEYSGAVMAQRTTMWHLQAMTGIKEVLDEWGVNHLLDIGSGFNPLKGQIPRITAVDAAPGDPSVVPCDFLTVEIRAGLTDLEIDSETGQCVAVPEGLYDAALLSLVLKSLNTFEQRRLMVKRAAAALELGGALVIVERSALPWMLGWEDNPKDPWTDLGLRFVKMIRVARNTKVFVFEKFESKKSE